MSSTTTQDDKESEKNRSFSTGSEDSDSDTVSGRSSLQSPGSRRAQPLRTNKNGLPREIQKEILLNVLLFRGNDTFKATCNENPAIYGYPSTSKRKAVQSKRHNLVKLYKDKPAEFLKLCSEFGIEHYSSAATTISPIALQFSPDSPASYTTESHSSDSSEKSTIEEVHKVKVKVKMASFAGNRK